MDYRKRTLEELQKHASRIGSRIALIGFDGFIDKIVHPVSQRQGQGAQFTPMRTISEFGERILGAAGKSTNIELFPVMDKLGGNGPIMASALLAAGMTTRYIGALGRPQVHGVFHEFADRAQATSIADPSITTAIEFADGKVMLGNTVSLDDITFDAIIEHVGEGALVDLFSRADLIGLVNWTMIPNMTAIFTALLARIVPVLPPRDQRLWFFDLADPEKRSKGDLVVALNTIARFQPHGSVTLGLNLKESQQVSHALGLPVREPDAAGLKDMARAIRERLAIGTVVIHPKESAVCANREGVWSIEGPYTDTPKLTTGAGDHFNAGFVTGQLLGLSPVACLTLGACFSGCYVRTARSPSLNDIDAFLRDW
ncbi:MAG: PfkB family carbohydrate kinase [Opitutaceae bacterium]